MSKIRKLMEKHEEETIKILEEFKTADPWNGKIAERKEKFREAFKKLRKLYGIETAKLYFAIPKRFSHWKPSGWSCYNRLSNAITLKGRLSVITFLHEFAHALGVGERGAVTFSIHYFRIVFPDQFAKLRRTQRAGSNPFYTKRKKDAKV